MQKRLVLLIIGLAVGQGLAREVKPVLSLRYACLNKPFLSVSVFTPRHDSFPDVELRLIDPGGHDLARGKHKNVFSKFHSGRVIELRQLPEISRAVAAEVCDATQGDYALIVSEHTNAEYRLAVSADDGSTGSEAMDSAVLSRPGRTCTYPFRVLMQYHSVRVRWLASDKPMQAAFPDPICKY
jgi:hypothetical protein